LLAAIVLSWWLAVVGLLCVVVCWSSRVSGTPWSRSEYLLSLALAISSAGSMPSSSAISGVFSFRVSITRAYVRAIISPWCRHVVPAAKKAVAVDRRTTSRRRRARSISLCARVAHDAAARGRRTAALAAMEIRKLQSDDLSDLLALYKHLHSSDTPLPTEFVTQSVWGELMSNGNYRYYGAFVGRRLVSSCTLTVIPNLTRSCRPYGVIENVVTHSDHRKRGYATALLKAALADAWTARCYKVMLLTGRKDEGTFRFYEAAGFDRNEKQAFIAKPA
jgi:ribosomal protein S18 acetylase RimI-like enzyme